MIKLEIAYNDIVDDDFYKNVIPPLLENKFDISLYGDKKEILSAKNKFGDLYKYTLVNNFPINDYNEIVDFVDFAKTFNQDKIIVYSIMLGNTLIENNIPNIYLSVLNSIRSMETVYEVKRSNFMGFVLAHDKIFDIEFQKECSDLGLKLIGLVTMGCVTCMAFTERHHTIYMRNQLNMCNFKCPTLNGSNPIKLNIVPPTYMLRDEFSSIHEFKFSGRFLKYPGYEKIYKDLLLSFLAFDDEKFVFLMIKFLLSLDDEKIITKYADLFLKNKKFCAYHCWECGENCDDKFRGLI